MARKIINPLIYCACGCGQKLQQYDDRGRERRHIKYHSYNKGKPHPLSMKDKVKLRTSRERALNILKRLGKTKCEISNGYCLGRLEAHHIDKNPFNNEISNLTLLCNSHHKLADRRNLNLDELRNFNLKYIVSSGTRRYRKDKK
jgi:hypothetical protein